MRIAAAVLVVFLSLLAAASAARPKLRTTATATVAAWADERAGSQASRCPSAAGCGRRKEENLSGTDRAVAFRSGESIAEARADGARAVAVARSVRVLDGLVTAYGVRRAATTDGGDPTLAGGVQGLRVDGEAIGDVRDARRIDLRDGLGFVEVNTAHAGIRVRLERDHDGFPAGTEVRVASVAVTARVQEDEPQPREDRDRAEGDARPERGEAPERRGTKREARRGRRTERRERRRAKRRERAALVSRVRSTLLGEPFRFPVFGPEIQVADDFGGPRQIGPHQGNDIFGPFGAPVVAVSDGRVMRVGTLPISGNRLWLVRDDGIAFFYAHLSAFAPAAVTGTRVRAGEVLGFTGNTGDAEPTPPHVHFEVHPRGIDSGALDPHAFLQRWRAQAPGGGTALDDGAQRPGALVQVDDYIAD